MTDATTYYLLTGNPDPEPLGELVRKPLPGIPVEVCVCGALVVAERLAWHMGVHKASGVFLTRDETKPREENR